MDKFEKKMKEALHKVTNGLEVSDKIKEKWGVYAGIIRVDGVY